MHTFHPFPHSPVVTYTFVRFLSTGAWIQEDDIFIVDRGFRDAIPLLQDLGIQAEMPKFMIKGQKQLSTEDANSSRLVTKVSNSLFNLFTF